MSQKVKGILKNIIIKFGAIQVLYFTIYNFSKRGIFHFRGAYSQYSKGTNYQITESYSDGTRRKYTENRKNFSETLNDMSVTMNMGAKAPYYLLCLAIFIIFLPTTIFRLLYRNQYVMYLLETFLLGLIVIIRMGGMEKLNWVANILIVIGVFGIIATFFKNKKNLKLDYLKYPVIISSILFLLFLRFYNGTPFIRPAAKDAKIVIYSTLIINIVVLLKFLYFDFYKEKIFAETLTEDENQ